MPVYTIYACSPPLLQRKTSKIDIRIASGSKRESPNHDDCSGKEIRISFLSTHLASRYSQSLTGRTEDNVSPFTER